MFPFGSVMKALAEQVETAIPESLSDRYVPWDFSVSNGRWSTVSYEEGRISASGCFAICLSGHGCPRDLDRYLREFLALDGVRQLKAQLECLTHGTLTPLIELS
jgi:hypothetical protein